MAIAGNLPTTYHRIGVSHQQGASMSDALSLHSPHEPPPWSDLTPDQVLERLVYDLYTPVSALGDEVDRLASGAFEDEELLGLIDQIRESVNSLSRLVVTLKHYTKERRSEPAPHPPETPPDRDSSSTQQDTDNG
jgi:hypothetical protein